MKKLFIIAFTLGLMLNLYAGDYKDFNWGDSRIQVIRKCLEEDIVWENDEQILLATKLLGFKSDMFLNFFEGKLYSIKYSIHPSYKGGTSTYIENFKTFLDVLNKKYGQDKTGYLNFAQKPLVENKEYYQENRSKLEKGLALGDLFLHKSWTHKNTSIVLDCSSKKVSALARKVVLTLLYKTTDKKLLKKVKDSKSKQAEL